VFSPTLSHGREAFYFAGREWLFYGGTTELAAEKKCRGHRGGGPRRPSDAAEPSNAKIKIKIKRCFILCHGGTYAPRREKMTIFLQMSLG
jgi:hypothetical protein